jgi:ribonuclease HI
MTTKKFYAVKVGRKPGIYTEWYGPNGAKVQVEGFLGANYKGFLTEEEANAFMRSSHIVKKHRPKPAVSVSKSEVPGHRVLIYTDGSCIYNPGPGGYGVVILKGKSRTELSGGYRSTTNNRMELMACIYGLKALKKSSSVTVYSDSQYVVNGINKGWAKKWQANNWIKKDKTPAQNPDLWEKLLFLCQEHDVEFRWVKGHAETIENLRCDELANRAASGEGLRTDNGYESN